MTNFAKLFGTVRNVDVYHIPVLALAVFSYGLVIAIALSIFFFKQRQVNRLRTELRRTAQVVDALRTGHSLEDALKMILKLVAEYVDAPYFAFYVRDQTGSGYSLRAVIHSFDDFNNVQPSYSGLALPNKEVYLPPVQLETDRVPDKISLTKHGDVPLLVLPFASRCAAIRIGPINGVSKRAASDLLRFLERIDTATQDFIELEILRRRSEVAVTAERAVQNIASMAADPAALLELIIPLYVRGTKMLGGLIIECVNGQFECSKAIGDAKEILAIFRGDTDTMARLCSWVEDTPQRLLQTSDEEFYALPTYLSTIGLCALSVIRLSAKAAFVVFLGTKSEVHKTSSHELAFLDIIANELVEMDASRKGVSQYLDGYTRILKRLAIMVDNSDPRTVGYSDMVTRYSLAIGFELGLNESEMFDIALAASFNNIGILGLSMDLLRKEGKYSELEYEVMKLHAQIGASMIQIATGNRRAASYIMSHHERVDGQGYPEGLRGEEIPIGARIIAVVQVFLAKINARALRSPLPFYQAVEMLRSAAGTHLDPRVVDAFLSWLERKQTLANHRGRSLGICSEMAVVPSEICRACAVWKGEYKANCWEYEDNNCQAHGRSCDSCFVKSEYLSRIMHMRAD